MSVPMTPQTSQWLTQAATRYRTQGERCRSVALSWMKTVMGMRFTGPAATRIRVEARPAFRSLHGAGFTLRQLAAVLDRAAGVELRLDLEPDDGTPPPDSLVFGEPLPRGPNSVYLDLDDLRSRITTLRRRAADLRGVQQALARLGSAQVPPGVSVAIVKRIEEATRTSRATIAKCERDLQRTAEEITRRTKVPYLVGGGLPTGEGSTIGDLVAGAGSLIPPMAPSMARILYVKLPLLSVELGAGLRAVMDELCNRLPAIYGSPALAVINAATPPIYVAGSFNFQPFPELAPSGPKITLDSGASTKDLVHRRPYPFPPTASQVWIWDPVAKQVINYDAYRRAYGPCAPAPLGLDDDGRPAGSAPARPTTPDDTTTDDTTTDDTTTDGVTTDGVTAPDGTTTSTSTTEGPDGSTVTTTKVTHPSGATTTTITTARPNGTSTTVVTAVDDDGDIITTTTEVGADGEVITSTETHSAGDDDAESTPSDLDPGSEIATTRDDPGTTEVGGGGGGGGGYGGGYDDFATDPVDEVTPETFPDSTIDPTTVDETARDAAAAAVVGGGVRLPDGRHMMTGLLGAAGAVGLIVARSRNKNARDVTEWSDYRDRLGDDERD